MVSPVRVSARTRSLLKCSVWAALAASLVAAACTDQGPSSGTGGTSSISGATAGGTTTGGAGGENDSGGTVAISGAPMNEAGSDAGGETSGGQAGRASGGEGGVNGGEGGAGGPAAGAGGEPPVDEDAALPCAIKNLLGTRCQGCHGKPPVGSSVSLLTHSDLTAPSKSDTTLTVAARSLKRMKDALTPMPPSPAVHATAEEIAVLQNWIDAGAPRGQCHYDPNDPNSNPYDAPVKCSSGNYWTANDTGSTWMMPGRACVTCHRMIGNSFAPQFSVAGTVFPTAHEPDKCYGVPLSSGAKIIVTDANDRELPPIDVVSGGNFGIIIPDFARPYRAKIVVGDSERVMLTPQMNGDCNSCHSQNGAQGALGRIILP